MSKYAATAAQVGDKYLESLAEGQDRILEYVRASKDMMPPAPEPTQSAADFGIPTMKDVADLQFGFATKMLEQQRRFFRRLYSVPADKPAARASAVKAAPAATKRKTKAAPRSKKPTN